MQFDCVRQYFKLEASSWKELVDKVKPQFAQVLAHKFDDDDLKSAKRKLKLQSKNKQFVESCCQQAVSCTFHMDFATLCCVLIQIEEN